MTTSTPSRRLLLGAAAAAVAPVWAQIPAPKAVPFEEGADFVNLELPAPVLTRAGQIELVEFFWYRCPFCNQFEPLLEARKPSFGSDVALRRVPIAFRDDFVPLQRMFFALQRLGAEEKMHPRIYAALHTEKLPLANRAEMTEFVSKHGVEADAFAQAYDSDAVTNLAVEARNLQAAYRVMGVPSLGIAGRSYTDGSLAREMRRMLDIADHLIQQQRSLLKAFGNTA